MPGQPTARSADAEDWFARSYFPHGRIDSLICWSRERSTGGTFLRCPRLKFPELTPVATVARLPAYLRELLQFDGIAAVSEDSAASLRDYWHWLGVNDAPVVHAIPLGIESSDARRMCRAAGSPRILCVGTIEGRKNHPALLEASESLWREGLLFELELIGLARADTAAPALAIIERLAMPAGPWFLMAAPPRLRCTEPMPVAHFTVYPSLIEGFGLPVLESLRHGKPCVCSARGALGSRRGAEAASCWNGLTPRIRRRIAGAFRSCRTFRAHGSPWARNSDRGKIMRMNSRGWRRCARDEAGLAVHHRASEAAGRMQNEVETVLAC